MNFQEFLDANEEKINSFADRISRFKIDGKTIEFPYARQRTVKWLENFENAGGIDLNLPLRLLEDTEFIQSSDIFEKLYSLAELYLRSENAFIAPLGEISESSFRITAFNNNHENFRLTLPGLLDSLPDKKKNTIILFDDFLNSGGQLITIFKRLLNVPFEPGEINDEGYYRATLNGEQKRKLLNAEIHLFFYKAFDEGIEKVEEVINKKLKLKVKIHRHLVANQNDGAFGDEKDKDRILNKQVGYIQTPCTFIGRQYGDITNMYRLLSDVGIQLLKSNEPGWIENKCAARALGYGNQCRLIITEFNVPTVTITALWHEGPVTVNKKKFVWQSLLPRRKKVLSHEDPNLSVEEVVGILQSKSESIRLGHSSYSIEQFHYFVLENYLKRNLFFDPSKSDELFRKYSDMFLLILRASKGGDLLNLTNNTNIFKTLTEFVISSKSQNPLLISGLAGSGKSSFLSVLYWQFYLSYTRNKSTKLPLYINLNHYNKYFYPLKSQKIFDQAAQKLRTDLEPILDNIKKDLHYELVIIVDGTDEYDNPKVQLDDLLIQLIKSLPVKCKIIGLRNHSEEHKASFNSYKPVRLIDNPEIKIELNKIPVDSPVYQPFLQAIAKIEATIPGRVPAEIAEYLDTKVKMFKLEEVDLFLMKLFLKVFNEDFKYEKVKRLSGFYKTYLEDIGIDLSKSAELAFKLFNLQDELTDKEKNCPEWWVIQKHESLRDYLVAYNIVKKLVEYNPKNQDVFNFVYPYDLNNFCKEIINNQIDLQNKAFNAITKLIDNVEITAQTHLCYLLGRFDNSTVKDKAKAFLLARKTAVDIEVKNEIPFDSTKKLSIQDKKKLLYLRTIYISLIYLGENKSSSEYIRQLIHNKYFDNLNRGFHLEYYKDIVYTPGSPDTLKNEDDLNPFPKTYNRLDKKLREALNNKKFHSMFEVELYTLCSLCQHRQANGCLDEKDRESISLLTDTIVNKHHDYSHDHEFLMYMNFVNERFKQPGKFKIGTFIKELYGLKSLERAGWVKRKVNKPESVAAHMYGAFMLGYLHLPSHVDGEPKYNKEDILRMILVHDLAEAYIGDLIPEEKTNDTNKKEQLYFDYLNLIGTYEGVYSVAGVSKLFSNFTHNENNINCKIARELDKLDCLLQLYLYHNDPEKGPISGFDEFKKSLIDYIKTDIGYNIRDVILDLFDDR